MTHLTAAALCDLLNKYLDDGTIKGNYNIAVWVKDGSGREAIDLLHSYDIDTTEGFIAFNLAWSKR